MATTNDELRVKVTLDTVQAKREVDILHTRLNSITGSMRMAVSGGIAGAGGGMAPAGGGAFRGAAGAAFQTAATFAKGFGIGPNIRRGMEIQQFYMQQWQESMSPARGAALNLQAKDRAVQATISQLGIAASVATPAQRQALFAMNKKIADMEVAGEQAVIQDQAKEMGITGKDAQTMLVVIALEKVGDKIVDAIRSALMRF